MYKISDFSKITNLSVKALRYYDEEGMLTPTHRNSENSYRYYSEQDFLKAQFIAMLRGLDFSISEIKDILSTCENPEDLSYYLEEKKAIIEGNITKEKELLHTITLYINSKNREDLKMDYKIEMREIAPVTVASVRYMGKYSDVGKYIGKIYKAVKGNGAGAPLQLYYDGEFKEVADIELCVPITKGISDPSVTVKTLPAVKALCTTHKGGYDKINLAYKSLFDYANDNHITCLTPTREIYVKGPGMIFKGNENNYVTEIIIPFEVL